MIFLVYKAKKEMFRDGILVISYRQISIWPIFLEISLPYHPHPSYDLKLTLPLPNPTSNRWKVDPLLQFGFLLSLSLGHILE